MKRFVCFIFLLFGLSFAFAAGLDALTSSTSQLPISPTQAFQLNATLESGQNSVKVHFNIMPGFYIYKDRLSFKIDNQESSLAAVTLPAGFKINVFNGESYSDEWVLSNKFDVIIPLTQAVNQLTLAVDLQGCDGKTICYPPQKYQFELGQEDNFFISLKKQFKDIYSGSTDEANNLKNPIELFLVFFLAGIAISLTPCMYPLYPIALSAISKTATKKSNIIKLALCYIHGISLVYVLMGILAAFSGKLLIAIIQTPVFVLISSLIMLILGFAMFDLLEIKLPWRVQNYINNKSANISGGRYLPVFILGVLSSLLLGPCVTPPLIIAIGFIAHSGNVLDGVLGLYAISLGMGLPIIILSTLGNKLLPKSGMWMNSVKYIMGLLIITIAIYMAYPLINLCNQLLSIGVLCFLAALIFLIIKHLRPVELDILMHKLLPILMIAIGLIFTVLSANTNVSDNNMVSENVTSTKSDVSRLKEAIAASDKPVIIIISAKWCSICRELAATTFKDAALLDKFKQYTVLELDITNSHPEYSNFLNQYNLYGPPAILILDKDKKLQGKITGYITASDLIHRI